MNLAEESVRDGFNLQQRQFVAVLNILVMQAVSGRVATMGEVEIALRAALPQTDASDAFVRDVLRGAKVYEAAYAPVAVSQVPS